MQSTQATCKRDDTFYFNDGSCTIRVEDTLFNLHRSILSKDSSSFSTMFSLPQGGKPDEGTSDDNPVVLAGDTVSEFKHFLWSLYALPLEIATVTSEGGDLVQLIDIAQVANKYSFKSTETWALDAIYRRVTQHTISSPTEGTSMSASTSESTSTTNPTPLDMTLEQLTRVLRLTQLCHHQRLLDTLVDILTRLTKTSVHYAFMAMAIADELDIPSLRGVSYLEVLQNCSIDRWSMPDFTLPNVEKDASGEELPVITLPQRTRLLTGYYRLARTWERIRAVPPEFEHAQACGVTWHQHGCTLSWADFWREKNRSEGVLCLGAADVLGKLKHIQKEYEKFSNTTYMHHECRHQAKKCLLETIKKIEDALPHFFSDPL
ncbi:hypothetical protein AX14_013702 [Amanita brunnescens Koide BX004]|nr:hypothetical protein AX14_013702 [Amanita brunnescens Koide BX004]